MINLYFANDSEQRVIQLLEQSIPRLLAGIELGVNQAMEALKTYIQKDKLQGQVLNSHQNGAGLAGSLNVRVERNGDVSIAAYVGTAQVYARIHEYGFDGTESVSAHQQRRTQAFGRTVAPYTVFIRAHERNMHMPERSYMRSSLDEKRDAIMAMIRDSMAKAVQTA